MAQVLSRKSIDEPATTMPKSKKVLQGEWGQQSPGRSKWALSKQPRFSLQALRWIMMIAGYGPLRIVENREFFQKLIKEFIWKPWWRTRYTWFQSISTPIKRLLITKEKLVSLQWGKLADTTYQVVRVNIINYETNWDHVHLIAYNEITALFLWGQNLQSNYKEADKSRLGDLLEVNGLSSSKVSKSHNPGRPGTVLEQREMNRQATKCSTWPERHLCYKVLLKQLGNPE